MQLLSFPLIICVLISLHMFIFFYWKFKYIEIQSCQIVINLQNFSKISTGRFYILKFCIDMLITGISSFLTQYLEYEISGVKKL